MSLLVTFFYTTLTLLAFAANSVLCRVALAGLTIDPVSFTTVRLVSGAIILAPLSRLLPNQSGTKQGGDWISAAVLFLYAVPFSFSYVTLSAGTGALILFGTVQVTMIVAALYSGERPLRLEWVGMVVALMGLVYLVFPGVSAPTPLGASLMVVAGIAWGIYSVRGSRNTSPVSTTAGNFVRTIPFAAGMSLMSLLMLQDVHLSSAGVLFAGLSGVLASGVGYIFWFAALRRFTVTQAAIVQLTVPVLAAIGGVVLLSEAVSFRLGLSSILILGGSGGCSKKPGTRVRRLKVVRCKSRLGQFGCHHMLAGRTVFRSRITG